MNMTLGIEQHIIRLHIAVDDALGMDILQGTGQLGDPEANGILGKAFPGNMEPEVTAIHQIDDNVTTQSARG